jgi:hypothetical protein
MLDGDGQVFAPLTWLGSLYSMIVEAWTGVADLADLLYREKPDIVDLPQAPPLKVCLPSPSTTPPPAPTSHLTRTRLAPPPAAPTSHTTSTTTPAPTSHQHPPPPVFFLGPLCVCRPLALHTVCVELVRCCRRTAARMHPRGFGARSRPSPHRLATPCVGATCVPSPMYPAQLKAGAGGTITFQNVSFCYPTVRPAWFGGVSEAQAAATAACPALLFVRTKHAVHAFPPRSRDWPYGWGLGWGSCVLPSPSPPPSSLAGSFCALPLSPSYSPTTFPTPTHMRGAHTTAHARTRTHAFAQTLNFAHAPASHPAANHRG